MKNINTKLAILFGREHWNSARKLILSELKKDKSSHWLLTRLGTTYYEERNYKKALEIEKKALLLAPKCPLVLWDYAGTLQALDKDLEAIQIYKKLIRKGINRIATEECGEGIARARGLIADCYFRLSISLFEIGKKKEGLKAFENHLELRGPGCRSIYSIEYVGNQIGKLTKNS
jgi:tetratricopeptide (TPR) repeat protein